MKKLIALLFLFFSLSTFATNLKIENIRVVNRPDMVDSPVSVIFDISWQNAWKNDKNHDAAWVFMKFAGFYNHVKLLPDGHRTLQKRPAGLPTPKIEVSADSLGFFIYVNQSFRGDLNYKLQILLDTSTQKIDFRRARGFKVFGVEMVYIPQGSFTLGSPEAAAEEKAAFYKSDEKGRPDGLVIIKSEAEIEVSPKTGKLYYWSEYDLYNGDRGGPVPAAFPKGYDAFYIMKYELTQGQYTDFLNDMPDNWTYTRSPLGGRDYYKRRGGIRLEDGRYVVDSRHRPMNHVSFTDGLAYSDWAALRPITELEYTKAARGPGKAVPGEFVWGTADYNRLERYVNPDFELKIANGWDESQLNDKTRAVFGASYYWVMDLSGSLWEKVITIGNPIGRQFKGTHGDGLLSFGHATNEDWPKSDDEEGGFGYRGGGYYQIGTEYSDFNPHSPIGHRYYGAWSGGPRYLSYGYRAGRSAK